MSGWQARYWLIKRGRVGLEEGEAPVKDFVSKDFVSKDFMCCKVPVGEDSSPGLLRSLPPGRARRRRC